MIKKINVGHTPKAVIVMDVESPECIEWCQHLRDTFEHHRETAAGIALNQIWDEYDPPLKIFIARIPGQVGPEIFINPVGKGSGGHVKNYEKCLSFPNLPPIMKSRWKNYTILYTREDDTENSFKVGQPWCRALQHEVDHLNGVVCYPRKKQ